MPILLLLLLLRGVPVRLVWMLVLIPLPIMFLLLLSLLLPPVHPGNSHHKGQVRDAQVRANVPDEIGQVGFVFFRHSVVASVVPSLVPRKACQFVIDVATTTTSATTITAITANDPVELREGLKDGGQHRFVVQAGRSTRRRGPEIDREALSPPGHLDEEVTIIRSSSSAITTTTSITITTTSYGPPKAQFRPHLVAFLPRISPVSGH
mmetsp:Transcript_14173/g.30025  ORF Transcript_14173/g.30025 Transcript_14173/m.30025 type:complete len:208 (-) Transcript_14173:157-780(-)